jgi:galactose-1-phosphate uridylyltransferase
VRTDRGDPDLWDRLSEALDVRVASCMSLPLQVPTSDEMLVDPLAGSRVILSPGRGARPHTAGNADPGVGGPYGEGRTPPTLFYVPAASSGPGLTLVVETETESLEVVGRQVGALGSAWEAVEALGAERRVGADGIPVPLVFPSEPWLARTFLNVAPIARHPGSGANGFVIAVHPDREDADLSASGGAPILAPRAVEAVVWSWALLQRWADRRGLYSVPFINGGKDPGSGQSLRAFHAQFYALDSGMAPPIYGRLGESAGAHRCPLCELTAAADLEVDRIGSVSVCAHPAPDTECTLLVTPMEHVGNLTDLSSPADMSRALSAAVGAFEHALGTVPPYNVAVRAGVGVGHLHAEVIPRRGVPVAGGFEKATGFAVATRAPAEVAATIRARLGRRPDAG